MTPVRRSGATVLIGAVCGMRTFTGPAVLALRGQMAGPARLLLTAVAAGEAIGDKTAIVPARTSAPSFVARMLSGALSGRALAGAPTLGVAEDAVAVSAATLAARIM